MSIKLIQDRLNSYNCKSEIEEQQAIREITQEVTLAALGRTDFFKHAAFQGGTCLRIFYGLNRFSEDMDFILHTPDNSFELKTHLDALTEELNNYGYQIKINDRSKVDSIVKKAFLKDDSLGKVIQLNYSGKTGPLRKIQIKLEVDTNPPAGGKTELSILDFPFISSVTTQDKPTLFAGKIHALLCREYIKGRDWYDFLWYTSRYPQVNYDFLSSALNQLGPWKNQSIQAGLSWLTQQLKQRIMSLDFKATVQDVRRFIRLNELRSLDLWSQELFLSQLSKLQ
ncbi:MAG: nucleotidyl transferase AbiEii/AbiGii toxin family protein [Phycisphaerae bacterium]|nr:nucleotidyl transferase AbiEii/AbiGii toxin family protein [Phycisphaerae bacterium]